MLSRTSNDVNQLTALNHLQSKKSTDAEDGFYQVCCVGNMCWGEGQVCGAGLGKEEKLSYPLEEGDMIMPNTSQTNRCHRYTKFQLEGWGGAVECM